jgi:Tfp pilus assembly protein PilZ
MGGCYVDVLNPFAQGAEVQLKIVRDQGTFEAKAKVAYCDPKFGMGLAFSEMTAADRAVLENWLVEMVTQLRPTT